MGLTFEKNNQLEKMLDKFAILPDDPKKKKAQNSKAKDKNKDKYNKRSKQLVSTSFIIY